MSGADPSSGRTSWLWRVWFYAAMYSFALLFANYSTGFHVGLNDFWGNYYQAEHLDFADPQTLYDGFFPLGYPLLLHGVPVDDLLAAGFLLGAAGRILLLGVFGSLALLLMPGPWALVATIVLSLVPRVFQHVLTPAADIPMLIPLTAGGALLIWGVVTAQGMKRTAWAMIGAGALLGLAGLFRQHALALALGLMIGCVAIRPRAIVWVFLAGVACTAAYAPQMAVNVWSGHGPLETAQYVNIYKMTHGVELGAIPLDLSHDVRGIVAEDPQRFFTEWARHFVGMLPLLLPAFVAGFWRGDAAFRRTGRVLAIGGTFYLAAVALGWSHRAVLPVLPWTIALTAALLYRAHAYISQHDETAGRRLLALGCVGLIAAGMFASHRNALLIRYYAEQHHRFAMIEHLVVATGAVHPKQVYTTDGDLYLPLTPPHFPYFDGTWGLFSLYRYAERYPRLDRSSLEAFRQACMREGITHVVVARHAPGAGVALDRLLDDAADSGGFALLGEIAGYDVYKRR